MWWPGGESRNKGEEVRKCYSRASDVAFSPKLFGDSFGENCHRKKLTGVGCSEYFKTAFNFWSLRETVHVCVYVWVSFHVATMLMSGRDAEALGKREKKKRGEAKPMIHPRPDVFTSAGIAGRSRQLTQTRAHARTWKRARKFLNTRREPGFSLRTVTSRRLIHSLLGCSSWPRLTKEPKTVNPELHTCKTGVSLFH